MAMQVDLKVVELLCSRLCHDLVGPVGAVNNGIELLEDFEPSMAGDVLPLITTSAQQAWRRLDFFRVAFGFAGGGRAWRAGDLRKFAAGWLEGGKTSLDWPGDAQRDTLELDGRAAKLLLNLVLVGEEALPRGGRLRVLTAGTGQQLMLSVTAAGPNARFHDLVAATLDRQVGLDALDARTVQPYFLGLIADELEAPLVIRHEPDLIALSCEIRR